MKRIVVIGDFHLKSSEPHWTGQKKLLNYFREKYHDCTLIFTGDLFDTSSPRWEVFTEFLLFCKMFEGEIHIVHGNHEYSQIKGSALLALEKVENVKIYFQQSEVKIEGQSFLMLPYRYSHKEMLEYQSNVNEYDYVVTHITPPKYQFNSEGIQLNCKAKAYLHGHIHVSSEFTDELGHLNVMVGVPQTTRNLEQSETKRVIVIENGEWTSETLPIYMEIVDIKYGELPENKANLYNVYEAPSKKSVYELYNGYHIRDKGISFVTKSTVQSQSKSLSDFKDASLEATFKLFLKSQEKETPKDIVDCAFEYMERVK
jgi:DNA repair exonuclease SbcCD nuclease subunit